MISAIKNLIPDMVRIPSFIVVIASFVTLLQMVMQDVYKRQFVDYHTFYRSGFTVGLPDQLRVDTY